MYHLKSFCRNYHDTPRLAGYEGTHESCGYGSHGRVYRWPGQWMWSCSAFPFGLSEWSMPPGSSSYGPVVLQRRIVAEEHVVHESGCQHDLPGDCTRKDGRVLGLTSEIKCSMLNIVLPVYLLENFSWSGVGDCDVITDRDSGLNRNRPPGNCKDERRTVYRLTNLFWPEKFWYSKSMSSSSEPMNWRIIISAVQSHMSFSIISYPSAAAKKKFLRRRTKFWAVSLRVNRSTLRRNLTTPSSCSPGELRNSLRFPSGAFIEMTYWWRTRSFSSLVCTKRAITSRGNRSPMFLKIWTLLSWSREFGTNGINVMSSRKKQNE